MRITQRRLTEIIEAEVSVALREFSSDDGGKKKGGKVSTAAADEEPTEPETPPGGDGDEPIASTPAHDGGLKDQEADRKQAGDEKDAEAKADKDEDDAIDPGGDATEHPSGAVNNEVSGKTIQAITIEPKSEVLKGAAKEIVITFDETTDPLRIEITQTGNVVFFWRGQLHDLP
jgi:hypothetical protein